MILSYDDLDDGQKVAPPEPGVLSLSQGLCLLYNREGEIFVIVFGDLICSPPNLTCMPSAATAT